MIRNVAQYQKQIRLYAVQQGSKIAGEALIVIDHAVQIGNGQDTEMPVMEPQRHFIRYFIRRFVFKHGNSSFADGFNKKGSINRKKSQISVKM